MDPLSSSAVVDLSNHGSTPTSNSLPTLSLVIVTTSSTYVYPILPKPSSPTAVLVDEIRAGLRCACVDWKACWVVLGRDEAVVGVGSGGRLGVVSYEGQYGTGVLTSWIHLIELLRAQVRLVHTPELCGRGSPCVTGYFCDSFFERCNESSWCATAKAHYRRILAVERSLLGFCEWGH